MSVVSGIAGSKATKSAAETQAASTEKASGVTLEMYEQSRQDQMPWLKAGGEALGKLSGGMYYATDKPTEADFTTPGAIVRGQGLSGLLKSASATDFDQEGYSSALAEWEASGVDYGAGMLEQGPGDFRESEYYQQGLDEEEKAINRYLASRGQYASGKAGKALSANAMANMNRNRGNWVNEWIATKLNPTQSLAGVGQSTAANVGGQGMQAGYQVGSNIMSGANAIAQGKIGQANILSSTSANTANAIAQYYGNKAGSSVPFNSPGSAATGNYGPVQG